MAITRTAKSKQPGLSATLPAKKKRVANDSGEKMSQPGTEAAPKTGAFREAAKTAAKT